MVGEKQSIFLGTEIFLPHYDRTVQQKKEDPGDKADRKEEEITENECEKVEEYRRLTTNMYICFGKGLSYSLHDYLFCFR